MWHGEVLTPNFHVQDAFKNNSLSALTCLRESCSEASGFFRLRNSDVKVTKNELLPKLKVESFRWILLDLVPCLVVRCVLWRRKHQALPYRSHHKHFKHAWFTLSLHLSWPYVAQLIRGGIWGFRKFCENWIFALAENHKPNNESKTNSESWKIFTCVKQQMYENWVLEK